MKYTKHFFLSFLVLLQCAGLSNLLQAEDKAYDSLVEEAHRAADEAVNASGDARYAAKACDISEANVQCNKAKAAKEKADNVFSRAAEAVKSTEDPYYKALGIYEKAKATLSKDREAATNAREAAGKAAEDAAKAASALDAANKAKEAAETKKAEAEDKEKTAFSYLDIARKDYTNAPDETLKSGASEIVAKAEEKFREASLAGASARGAVRRAADDLALKTAALQKANEMAESAFIDRRTAEREVTLDEDILKREEEVYNAANATRDHSLEMMQKTRGFAEDAAGAAAKACEAAREAVLNCSSIVTVDKVKNIMGANPWNDKDPLGGITLNPGGCNYNFSPWSDCKNGMMTRTGTTTDQVKCPLTQDMMFKTCSVICNYTYSDWSQCRNGKQTRTVLSSTPQDCTGTPETERSCGVTPPPPCTYEYAPWSACVNGNQTRTVSANPPGCTGTPDTLSRACSCFHSGAFSGCNGGCGFGGSLSIAFSGSTVTVSSFGVNGTQNFSASGSTATSSNTSLSVFGAMPHTCTLNCSGLIHCQRSNNASIQCSEQCTYQ